jgi:hypothetical protein
MKATWGEALRLKHRAFMYAAATDACSRTHAAKHWNFTNLPAVLQVECLVQDVAFRVLLTPWWRL